MGSLLASFSVFADETAPSVSTTKTSAFSNLINNSYGLVDVRHYYKHEKLNTDKKLTSDGYFQPRFNLGSKLFDGKLDSKFIFRMNNYHSEGKNASLISDGGTVFENDFTVYKNDHISVVPFAYFEFPKSTEEDAAKRFTKMEAGLDLPMNFAIPTNAGTFTLQGELIGKVLASTKPDPEGRVNLKGQNNSIVSTKNEKEFGLTEESKRKSLGMTADASGNYTVDQNGRSLFYSASAGLSYKPSFVAGLEAQGFTLWETTYTPIMEYNKETGKVDARSNNGVISYAAKVEPSHHFILKYSFNDTYSLLNEFILKDKEEGQQKFVNMVSFVGKVF